MLSENMKKNHHCLELVSAMCTKLSALIFEFISNEFQFFVLSYVPVHLAEKLPKRMIDILLATHTQDPSIMTEDQIRKEILHLLITVIRTYKSILCVMN